jgi:hypothetical protein
LFLLSCVRVLSVFCVACASFLCSVCVSCVRVLSVCVSCVRVLSVCVSCVRVLSEFCVCELRARPFCVLCCVRVLSPVFLLECCARPASAIMCFRCQSIVESFCVGGTVSDLRASRYDSQSEGSGYKGGGVLASLEILLHAIYYLSLQTYLSTSVKRRCDRTLRSTCYIRLPGSCRRKCTEAAQTTRSAATRRDDKRSGIADVLRKTTGWQ